MIHALIVIAVIAFVVYKVIKHSPKAAAEVATVEADVKADASKVEADIKKL